MKDKIFINRAPVLTLWASVVAERLGYERETALSLGQAVAGLNAQSKGRMLGIYGPPKEAVKAEVAERLAPEEVFWVSLLGRGVPAKKTERGIRAFIKEKPIEPAKVLAYLTGKFGEALSAVREAMEQLARSMDPVALEANAYSLYEQFRPSIPSGRRGWGAAGELDLELIRSLSH
jgi:hypothetical protein